MSRGVATAIDARSPGARANRAAMLALIAELEGENERLLEGGGERYVERHRQRGRLLVRERIDLLLDFAKSLPPLPERLVAHFTGVDFGAIPGLPAIDAGGTPPGTDPIRLGASGLASFSARGTASSGTVYIKSRLNAQYAVRIFGDTGKTRMLKFDRHTGRWRPL
jgi:hypothetical protein